MDITVTYYYIRVDGRTTCANGRLSTEHPASSYGIPVFVAEEHLYDDDPIVLGQAYGPADLPHTPQGHNDETAHYPFMALGDCSYRDKAAARRAGFPAC